MKEPARWGEPVRRAVVEITRTVQGRRPRHSGERALLAAGIALLLCGAIHAGLGPLLGDAFDGPRSIRKPALFGVATGITLLSLGWVDGLLRGSRRGAILACVTTAAALVEVGLITVQYWRGARSHFNLGTLADATMAWSIEGCALLLTITIGGYTVWSFQRPRGAFAAVSDAMRLAVRFGLASLLLGCLFGAFMVAHGHSAMQGGSAPGTYGDAGVLKFVHGTLLHSLQLIPAAVFVLELFPFRPIDRWRSTALTAASFAAFTAYAVVQTFSGAGRFDVTVPGALCLLLTGVLGVGSLIPLLPDLVGATRRAAPSHDAPASSTDAPGGLP